MHTAFELNQTENSAKPSPLELTWTIFSLIRAESQTSSNHKIQMELTCSAQPCPTHSLISLCVRNVPHLHSDPLQTL